MYKTVLIMLFVLLASACQTVTKEQCQTADWQQVGYEDGLKGLPGDNFANHLEACAKHEVVPVSEDYDLGHEGGLVLYCEPGSGFQQGREGVEYRDVCSPHLESAFLSAYKEGQLLGEHERELAALLDVKRSLETEIRNIDNRSDSRLFADLSRGERPRSIDLIMISESLDKQKQEMRDRVDQVTREISDLSKLIDSMLANIQFTK